MVADNFLQKQQKQRGRPFTKGRSGNPAGRPRGLRNRSTLAAQLLLQGKAEALTRKAVELALGGDPAALRLCLDRSLRPIVNGWCHWRSRRCASRRISRPQWRRSPQRSRNARSRRPKPPNWQRWSTPLPTPSRRAISIAGYGHWKNGPEATLACYSPRSLKEG